MTEAFRELGALNFDEIFNKEAKPEEGCLIHDYGRGKIDFATFRNLFKEKLDIQATDEEFDKAWNAMLLDLPPDRMDAIKN